MYLQKVISRKTFVKNLFFVGVLKVNDEKKQDPDPVVRGMDPRIRIRTKMSWIRNTVKNSDLPVGEYPLPKLDVLVVPRSFSGLGLASPNLTFISPSLLAGDPSLLGRAPPLPPLFGILVLLQVNGTRR
jgi:hypothetical protein